MSGWIDDQDDDEFLSANFGRATADSAADLDDGHPDAAKKAVSDGEPTPDDGEWNPSHGFPDPSNTIRIWTNDDGELTKIRVSLSWQERLKGSSIGDAFNVTLMFINNWYRVGRLTAPVTDLTALGATAPRQELSWEALSKYQQAVAELDAQLAELPPGPTHLIEGQEVSASDYEGAVKLTLDIDGYPKHVYIEDAWAQHEANASGIARAVMNCYRWAKAQWRPPSEELTERGQLLAEKERLGQQLFAMLPQAH